MVFYILTKNIITIEKIMNTFKINNYYKKLKKSFVNFDLNLIYRYFCKRFFFIEIIKILI